MENLSEMANENIHSTVLELLSHTQGKKVLDLGCGQGAFANRLKKRGFDVTAADMNKDNFKASDVPFVLWDLNKEIPDELRDQKFDAIVCIEVIEHIENQWKLIRDCYSLLVDEGTLILSTPNVLSWRSRLFFLFLGRFNLFFDVDRRLSGHINPIPIWVLSDILAQCRFRIAGISGNRVHFMDYYSIYGVILSCFFLLSAPIAFLIRTEKLPRQFSFLVNTTEILIVEAKKETLPHA